MKGTVRTFETEYNTHYVSYGRIAKTSYEQQQERKAELLYITFQKALGLILTALSIVPVIIYHEPKILFLTGIFALLGITVILTKDHVIG
jgi:hypothetical protein